MRNTYYRINQNIRASQVRVIGDDGKQVGILPIGEALSLANQKELDLVEIAPTANPPVTKIVDFKKFLYQEEKKSRESKKKNKGGEIKGIRLSPFIAQADLEVRVQRTISFLKEGNKVRVAVRFTGRQMGKRDFGYIILKKFSQQLLDISQPEGEPKWMGRELVLIFSPTKKQTVEKRGDQNAENKDQEVNSKPV
ncbi:MAG: translation initiation factor IF-3 [bacterium]|nr:translation initiation factor IF-3 [bacterium]